MVNWQITATTIYCEAVADEVTVMVRKDGSVSCTGHKKYFAPDKDIRKELEMRGRHRRQKLSCEGLGCYRVTQYRDRLFAEEAGEGRKKPGE